MGHAPKEADPLLCDVCALSTPEVYCEEDHARLCSQCDMTVRGGGPAGNPLVPEAMR
mgnify:CR=1 FL=1